MVKIKCGNYLRIVTQSCQCDLADVTRCGSLYINSAVAIQLTVLRHLQHTTTHLLVQEHTTFAILAHFKWNDPSMYGTDI